MSSLPLAARRSLLALSTRNATKLRSCRREICVVATRNQSTSGTDENRRNLRSSSFNGQLSAPIASGWAMPRRRMFSAEPKQDGEQKMEFKAETRQLLDIVTHSIYTDKEVFLRELISNASDAMEKLRHMQVAGGKLDPGVASEPMEISITTDSEANILTLEDTGVGMTKDELVENLGTIARSGSKNFVKELAGAGETKVAELSGIIGQFGVGFYSAFMVGDKVSVYSRSAKDGTTAVWSSDGSGEFTVSDLPADANIRRGCRIVIELKDACKEYADKTKVEKIIKKYSNFVGVPIKINGEPVNTVEAIWTKAPNEVDEEKYTEFYQFIAHAFDSPMDRLHFRMDAPLDIKALLFFPSMHTEKFGMGRMEPGVSMYCRKVLVEAKSPDILPEWLRFVKGVVDSEDLPLSISRETPQDSSLIKKLNRVLTRKIVRHIIDMKRKKPEKFKEFYAEYSAFLKEGACQDHEMQGDISKLLCFESSKSKLGEMVSFDEYISRCTPEQKEIYFLLAPDRETAEASPYFEAFKRSGREVLFIYNAIDDFVMTNLAEYNSRPLITAETPNLNLGEPSEPETAEKKEGDEASSSSSGDGKTGSSSSSSSSEALSEHDAIALGKWLQREALSGKVREVKTTTRLYDSPCIVSNNASGSMRRVMRMLQVEKTPNAPMPEQLLELNPRHPIIKQLNVARKENPEVAKLVAEQLFENALIAAGMLDDSRSMLPRLNALLEKVLVDDMKLREKDRTVAGSSEA